MLLIDFVLPVSLLASVLVTIYFIARDFRTASRAAVMLEDITSLRDEISSMRAEIAKLSAIVDILSTQLEAAGITPAIPREIGEPALIVKTVLKRRIVRHFNLAGINSLIFELGIDEDEIDGSTKSEKVESLIDHIIQTGEADKLVRLLKEKRPNTTWS